MCQVIAWTDLSGYIQHASDKPTASSGVNDKVGLPAAPMGCRSQGLRGQPELGAGIPGCPLHAGAGAHDSGARGDCVGEQNLVESWPWDVVGIRGHDWREARESEAEAVGG